MEIHVVWLAVVVTLASLAWQGAAQSEPPGIPFNFNCERNGVTCFGDNTVCGDEGVCTCPDGFQAPDCRMPTGLVPSEDPECLNICLNGLCVDDPRPRCICAETEVLMGNSCQQRAMVNCTVDALTFTVFPNVGQGAFTGTLIVTGQNISGECSPFPGANILDVQASVNEDSEAGKSITIPFSDCGRAFSSVLVDNSTRMSFKIVVAYNERIQTSTDEIYDARCILPASGSEMQVEPMVTTINGSVQEERPLESTTDLVFLEVGISDPLRIGDTIEFTYTLQEQDTYLDFELVDLKASSPESSGFLVEGGCIPATPLVKIDVSESESSFKIDISFKAFKFHDWPDVTYNSTLRVCRGPCPTPACAEGGSPLEQPAEGVVSPPEEAVSGQEIRRRRRRDTGDDDDVIEEFSTTLRVHSPVDLDIDDGSSGSLLRTFRPNGRPAGDECSRSIVLLVLAIVLAVLLVFATAACLFFCVRSRSGNNIINYGARTSGLENPVYAREYKR